MPQIVLRVLGAPVLERDGAPVALDTRKAIALMAYLAVTGQRHTRDALAALLWPEYDQSHARAALRRTLSALNKALTGAWLHIEREAVQLPPAVECWCDIQLFQQHLAAFHTHRHASPAICDTCLEHLREVALLYRGDFLAGFSLRDSVDFDDWSFAESEHLRREMTVALEQLTQNYEARSDMDEALRYARRWLTLDRLNENAHLHLMRLYAWSGKRAAALRQYQVYVQLLQQELGSEPSSEIARLYAQIKTNELAAPQLPVSLGAVATAAPSGPKERNAPDAPKGAHSAFPLVGRAQEWAKLTTTYEALATDGQVIVLHGETGIGKTRLAEAFLETMRAQGAPVLATRCYVGEAQMAYTPLLTGLRAAWADPTLRARLEALPLIWRAELARLVPEMAANEPLPAMILDDAAARGRFFESWRQAIAALITTTDQAPGILFIDDVHWADAATLEVLAYLLRRLRQQRCCLLLTWSDDQVNEEHPVQRLFAASQRAGLANAIAVTRLDERATQELITAYWPGAGSNQMQQLYRETEGVPLFLVAYLTGQSPAQQMTDDETLSLPASVRDVLLTRLHALNEASRHLVGLAAAIGHSFDLDLLCAIQEQSEETIITALEDLLQHGIIAETLMPAHAAQVVYDFSHAKLRTLAYERLSLARRRLLHRKIAQALIEQMHAATQQRGLAGRVAQHALLAGNETQAARYFKLAGDEASALFAHAEALQSLRQALQLGHPERAPLLEAMGDVQTRQGEYAAALHAYEEALAVATTDAIPRLHRSMANVWARRGAWSSAEQHMDAALALLRADDPQLALLAVERSRVAIHQQRLADALALATEGLALATSAGDLHTLALAHNMLGLLARHQGQLDVAQNHLQQSLDFAIQGQDESIRVAALNNLAQTAVLRGDYHQAITHSDAALALCVAQGDRHYAAALHNHLGEIWHALGDAAQAMAHLKAAVAIYADIGVDGDSIQPDIWSLADW